jgi:hypothetical protein
MKGQDDGLCYAGRGKVNGCAVLGRRFLISADFNEKFFPVFIPCELGTTLCCEESWSILKWRVIDIKQSLYIPGRNNPRPSGRILLGALARLL